MRIVDIRRLLLAAPLLAGVVTAVYFFASERGTGTTPRAQLVDTPAGAVDDVGVRKGDLARDFVALAPDESLVRLSDLRGRAVAINFWATWCTSCLAELPEFKRLQQEIGTERFAIVAVNAGEDSATAQEFLDELDVPAFRVGMDPTLVVSDAYGVFGLPTTVFLDADGVVRGVYTGQLRREDLDEFVGAALAAADAPEPDPQLRLITTVARDRLLEVRDAGDGRVDLRSKSLRCDETYCSSAAIDALSDMEGVTHIERRLDEDPPRIIVAFDESIAADEVASTLAAGLEALGDPLYERELEIVER